LAFLADLGAAQAAELASTALPAIAPVASFGHDRTLPKRPLGLGSMQDGRVHVARTT
jgi:hypothetical protein